MIEATKRTSLDFFEKRAIKLGGKKAKIIDIDSIALGYWVQWKCQYGCKLYNYDACHRPAAPSVDEMKKLLTDYNKALLINGADGKLISKIALDIEYEAVEMGYYKALSFIALPLGSGST